MDNFTPHICGLLGYYAGYIGKSLPKFLDTLSILPLCVKKFKESKDFLTLENGIKSLPLNVGKDLPLYAA